MSSNGGSAGYLTVTELPVQNQFFKNCTCTSIQTIFIDCTFSLLIRWGRGGGMEGRLTHIPEEKIYCLFTFIIFKNIFIMLRFY